MSRPAPDLRSLNDAFDCRATAAFLRAVSPLVWASHAGAVLAATQHAWSPLLAWGLVIYFAIRVRLDAKLLELLARDPAHAPAELDEWLWRAGLRARGPQRSIEDRCRGARRLVRYLAGACLLQAVATVVVLLRSNG